MVVSLVISNDYILVNVIGVSRVMYWL